MKNKTTIQALQNKKKIGEKIVALTAYDFLTAKLLDEVGIDLILVGDSLGMVVLGYENTLRVTLDEMIHHTKAVSRGVERAIVVGDMPFLSYGVDDDDTIAHAARFIQEGGAQGVKLEGGQPMAKVIEKMVRLGIPVLGHIGMTPTHVLVRSGYHVQGKDSRSQEMLIEDALALEGSGVFGIVLECVPVALAREITKKVKIPTLGIGAGPFCDGQILVSHDMLGLNEEFTPKFVRHYAHLSRAMKKAIKSYSDEVRAGKFPGRENSY